jgi:hypothetical protein
MNSINLLTFRVGRYQRGLWGSQVLCDVVLYGVRGTRLYFHTKIVQYGDEVFKALEPRSSKLKHPLCKKKNSVLFNVVLNLTKASGN